MSRRVIKLHGPPGTGKTHWLMDRLQQVLANGIPPERVGFISFSRRAIAVAKDRAAEISSGSLHNFRTIHSTAFRMLGLNRTEVLQDKDLIRFGEMVGEPVNRPSIEDGIFEGSIGARIIGLVNLASARGTSLREEWERIHPLDISWPLTARTAHAYERFKRAEGLFDFNDMIEKASGILDLDVLFVDEAQDTTAAQWRFIRNIAQKVPEIYLAGDDDQAIYNWSGADPATLLKIRADGQIKLPVSYRLPSEIKTLADTITRKIKTRVDKPFTCREEKGSVGYINNLDRLDLSGDKTFLLLARSNYQLEEFREIARMQGVTYTLPNGSWSWDLPYIRAAKMYEKLRKGKTLKYKEAENVKAYSGYCVTPSGKENYRWDDLFTISKDTTWMEGLNLLAPSDREYVRALRRSNEPLDKPGRVAISTVHGAKGEEADNVVLLTDISRKVENSIQLDPDAERRVQYVAVTRARESLTIVEPQTTSFWDFH